MFREVYDKSRRLEVRRPRFSFISFCRLLAMRFGQIAFPDGQVDHLENESSDSLLTSEASMFIEQAFARTRSGAGLQHPTDRLGSYSRIFQCHELQQTVWKVAIRLYKL